MPLGNHLILTGVGGFFIILGLAAYFWGRSEERRYFDAIATRSRDHREFLERWPPRPQPGGLKAGGWIALAIGLLLSALGIVFWLLP